MSSLFRRLNPWSPSKSQTTMTRQDSIESAFARVDARNASKDSSSTPPLTTGTSMTDNSSDPTEASENSDNIDLSSGRLQTSFDGHSEEMSPLDKHIPSTPKQSPKRESPTILEGNDPTEDPNDSQESLVKESIQALDEDWKIGAMPGDDLHLAARAEEPKRRKSTRLDFLGQPINAASNVVEKTASVLGKRGREVIEAGVQAFKVDRKPSLKTKEPVSTSIENPRKRARFSRVSAFRDLSPESHTKQPKSQKRIKHWLSQGLYVGQDSEFDPRLSETKNKLKKALTNKRDARRSSTMPLPIFAGERTLSMGRDFVLPYDVFHPLPKGQPQPDEWKKKHKNVFVGEAAELWKKHKSLGVSLCLCNEETGCDEHCLNRSMLYECDEENCNVGAEHCTNRSFADLKKRSKTNRKTGRPRYQEYNVGVEVVRTEDRGYGVRANRTFQPNQIIVEYTGEIITQEECDRRVNTVYKDAKCYYLMEFDQSMVLDATRGSIARFINHSCAPNCKMIKWTVAGKPRMALFAGDQGIMTGEELTYDYNFDPFSAKNVKECLCGAEECRGILGRRQKEVKDALKPLTATTGKRKISQTMDDDVETVTKKRKIVFPTSSALKSAFKATKVETSRRFSQAGLLGSSTSSQKLHMERKSPTKRATKELSKRKSTADILAAHEKEEPRPEGSRRRSTGNLLPRGWKGWVLADSPPPSPTVEELAAMEPAGTKLVEAEVKAPRAEEGMVRTVRRSNRGTPGKSIRVIALGDDELKEWR